jgi:hypothetical protein
MKRIIGIIMVLGLAACADQTTEPAGPSDMVSAPLFSASVANRLLASTNRGELVEIDLTAATTTLIGDAGLFEGREMGWTDIAFDAGNLFATSNQQAELSTDGCIGWFTGGQCSHLYVLDVGTGAVLAEIGSTGGAYVSDIDFAADGTLYGSKYIDVLSRGDGGFITLDPTTAALTLVGRFGPGVGLYDLENGGISVHPQTGDIWGIESNFSRQESIFRIDPATGLASDVTRLGLAGLPTSFGIDGFEILPNGTFVGLRAGNSSELYSINPSPDPISGLAELTLIPLTLDPAIVGNLNGLEHVGPVVSSDLVGDVEDLVSAGNLAANNVKSLVSKINLAQKFLDEGRVAQAISMLEAFINQVNGYVNGGNMSPEAGQDLIDAAQAVIDAQSGCLLKVKSRVVSRAGHGPEIVWFSGTRPGCGSSISTIRTTLPRACWQPMAPATRAGRQTTRKSFMAGVRVISWS